MSSWMGMQGRRVELGFMFYSNEDVKPLQVFIETIVRPPTCICNTYPNNVACSAGPAA